LYRQPALGGARQRIADRVDTNAVADTSGRRVIFRRNHARGESPGLFLLDDSGEHLLAISDSPYAFYFYYWTPGGKAIQYVGGSRLYSSDWTLQERVPGSPRETTILRGQQGPLAYPVMVERSGLFAVSSDPDTGLRQIWYISIPGGRRYRITHDAGEYISQSVTADGKTILANRVLSASLYEICRP
jgi:Tol biopolymer transport system component